MEFPKWTVPARNVEIISKQTKEQPVASSILAHFSSDRSPAYEAPYGSKTQTTKENYVPQEMSANSVELKVFKHKEVNSLILNRILSLENSVVSKTIEKKPLREVDETIKDVIKDQEDDEILEQLTQPKQESVNIPTSKIRQLAMEMQESRPVFELKFPVQPADTIIDEPTKNEPSKPNKPIFKKQYSFSMDKKFHEEKDNAGWKKIIDISDEDTESEEESDESDEESSEYDSPSSPIPIVKQSILNVKGTDPKEESTSDEESSESSIIEEPVKNLVTKSVQTEAVIVFKSKDEKQSWNNKTVERILDYEGNTDISPYEPFEEYLRRRNDQLGYDSDLTRSDSEYDSETYSEYSENTNAGDNSSFAREDYIRHDRYSDSETDGSYTEESNFDDDSVFEKDYTNRQYSDEYYTDDDEHTLVDESEFRAKPTSSDYRYDQDERYYSDDYSEFSDGYEHGNNHNLNEHAYYTDEDRYSGTQLRQIQQNSHSSTGIGEFRDDKIIHRNNLTERDYASESDGYTSNYGPKRFGRTH